MTTLELLSPARTADIGIEAIRHGADAVYIGPPRFGARQAAGNSIDDIRRLCQFAHAYGAHVYATLNTLLRPEELDDARALVAELRQAGVDALIVQDPAVRAEWGLPLHASTQMDNRTPERVRQLVSAGYQQVVLARELSLDDIRAIHEQCPKAVLEAFVHGALCVSLSGRCYASEILFGRSANRGECAQVCRMGFDLLDGEGHTLVRDRHLLSLRDMCRLPHLEAMAEAGIRSFKIEGRLKDAAYVKNVTAAYSQALDELCARRPQHYRRASQGNVQLRFTPDVRKSFNRGFTDYFLHGRTDDIHSFSTPKSLGEPVGHISHIYTDSIVVDAPRGVRFANGDGICTLDPGGRLVGMRVNRVDGSRLYPLDFIRHQTSRHLRRGQTIWRNHDKTFDDLLQQSSAERTIPVTVEMDYRPDRQCFELTIDDGRHSAVITRQYEPQLAQTHQTAVIQRQFSRLGGTAYRLEQLRLRYRNNYFIPSSLLTQWRRDLVAALAEVSEETEIPALPCNTGEPIHVARHSDDLMTCRHCLRYAYGWCPRHPRPNAGKAPRQLRLRLANGTLFDLHFDCRQCLMIVRQSQA